MKSHIDWNEIVPRLPAGLQQTLYLEAVGLVTNGAASAPNGARRKIRRWTPKQKASALKYLKRHTAAETARHYDISSGLLHTWIQKAKEQGK
jgi:hypothetical protein